MDKTKIVTLNVNGLRNDSKRRQLFHYLNIKGFEMMFLQELHSEFSDEKRWSMEFGTRIWFDHGSRNSKGVGILFSRKCQESLEVHNVIKSQEGHYLILYVTWKGMKILLGNIYAPNNDSPEFFQKVFRDIDRFSPHYSIVMGDLNLGIDSAINRMGSHCNNDKAAQWLAKHLKGSDLVDLWRQLYPDRHGFTWKRRRPTPIYSRLDYILSNKAFLQFLVDIKITPNMFSDHAALEMTISFTPHKRGPGYWKLNTALLRDADYVDKMNTLLDIELSQVKPGEFRKTWEVTKLAIRGSSIQYSARKQKSTRQKIEVLEKKLHRLEAELLNSNPLFTDKIKSEKSNENYCNLTKKKQKAQ